MVRLLCNFHFTSRMNKKFTLQAKNGQVPKSLKRRENGPFFEKHKGGHIKKLQLVFKVATCYHFVHFSEKVSFKAGIVVKHNCRRFDEEQSRPSTPVFFQYNKQYPLDSLAHMIYLLSILPCSSHYNNIVLERATSRFLALNTSSLIIY